MFASPAASESIHTPRRSRSFQNASHRRQRFSSGRWQKHNTCCQTMQLGVPDVPMQPYGCCITCQAAAEATAHLSNARPVSTCRRQVAAPSPTCHQAQQRTTRQSCILPTSGRFRIMLSKYCCPAQLQRALLLRAQHCRLLQLQRCKASHAGSSNILLPAS